MIGVNDNCEWQHVILVERGEDTFCDQYLVTVLNSRKPEPLDAKILGTHGEALVTAGWFAGVHQPAIIQDLTGEFLS